MICFLTAVLSCLLVLGCRCDAPPEPPAACEYITEDPATCDTLNGARCDVGEREALCPSDIHPGSDSGCSLAGLCDGMALALYCCGDPAVNVPIATTSTATTIPPFPPNPGDGACRPQADPSEWGCLPAWWLTGEAETPAACGTCGQPGEQVWVCEDAEGSHPPDCGRIGAAPFQSSGFYCCGCTI